MASGLQLFDLAETPASPWKNGGGSTREIMCWPPGADMDSFAWRISVASIAKAGPFSAFAGIDRQIMLLDGDGVHLQGQGIDHMLAQRWQPFAFDGAQALDCTLLGGASTDFNVMVRRGQWTAQLQVLDEPAAAGASAAGLCMVLHGQWQADGADQALSAGQGLWWSAAQAAALRLRPLGPQARLLQVLLQPTAPLRPASLLETDHA